MSNHPKFSLDKLQQAISMDYPKRLGSTPATTAAWDEVFRELVGTLQELDGRIRAVAQETQLAVNDLRERLDGARKR
jgi:monoamine oxidase